MKHVSVFRTNVTTKKTSRSILARLSRHLPNHRLTFDLEDCDRVFRVASDLHEIDDQWIIQFFKQENCFCEPL
jgi:RNase P protein component